MMDSGCIDQLSRIPVARAREVKAATLQPLDSPFLVGRQRRLQ